MHGLFENSDIRCTCRIRKTKMSPRNGFICYRTNSWKKWRKQQKGCVLHAQGNRLAKLWKPRNSCTMWKSEWKKMTIQKAICIFWTFLAVYTLFFTFFEVYEQGITCPASLAQEEASPTSEVVYFFSRTVHTCLLSLQSRRLTYALKHCVGPKRTSTLRLIEQLRVEHRWHILY